MRYMALDIGEKRIGVALSDSNARVASPHSVLDARHILGDPSPLVRLIDDYEIDELVVGLPLGLDGSEGPQSVVVRETMQRLEPRLGVPVTYHDERLTSAEARRVMSDSGMSEKEQRGAVDKVAAAIILQAFLDSHRSEREADQEDE